MRRTALLTALTMLLIGGCGESERLAEMAQQSTERQAEQNREMAKLNRQVSENAKQLVEADQEARKELTRLQREMVERDAQGRSELNAMHERAHQTSQAERQDLNRQRENLENQRRDIAVKRDRDPIIATAITTTGLILACLIPVILAIYLLRAQRHEEVSEQEVAELLVEELMAARSPLLGSPDTERPALGVDRPPEPPAALEDGATGEDPH